MAKRITSADLKDFITVINNRLKVLNKPLVALDTTHGSCRLTNEDGSVNLSPRLTTRELYWYLYGYMDGLERSGEGH